MWYWERERERDGARECINEGEKWRGNEARRSMKGGKQKKQGLHSGVLFYRSVKEEKSETLHPRESCNPIRANEISFECQKVREIVVRWGEEVAWMSRSGFPGRALVKGGRPPSGSLCSLLLSPLRWFPLSIRSILLLSELIHPTPAEKHSH